MRATLEVSQENPGKEVSPIEVRVFKTKNDITIKISDLGGGISRASSGKIFNYMYSTAPQVLNTNQCYFTSRLLLSPGHHSWRWRILRSRTLCGHSANAWFRLRPPAVTALRQILQARRRGFKYIYLTRILLYSRGDIKIASVDGYGTDVYVYLQRLSHLAQENLPVYNAVSSAKLRNSATQVNDWTDLGNTAWWSSDW